MKREQKFKIESEVELTEAYRNLKNIWWRRWTLETELSIYRHDTNFRYVIRGSDGDVLLGTDRCTHETIPNPFRKFKLGRDECFRVETEGEFTEAYRNLSKDWAWSLGEELLDFQKGWRFVRYGEGNDYIGLFKIPLSKKIIDNPFKNKNMDELKIKKERVLEAAEGCADVKRVMKKLFPEAFEDDKYFDLWKLNDGRLGLVSNEAARAAGFTGNAFMQVMVEGPNAGKSFWVGKECNWEWKDHGTHLELIPTKK